LGFTSNVGLFIDILKITATATQAGCLLYYCAAVAGMPHSMAGILPAVAVAVVFAVLFTT
jgi:hypothetical protein